MRSFQEKLGLRGSAFFARILSGSRPLSLENAKRIARGLDLSADKTEYLLELVRFGNEKNVDRREASLKRLLALRAKNSEYALQDSSLAFFSKWYVPVLRDLLPLLPAGISAQRIGRLMTPTLKASQVQGAVAYLLKGGFLKKSPDGSYQVTEAVISTPPRVRSTLLRKYHLKNLEIDGEAFEAFSADDRSLSSVSCSLSKESFEKVREEIRLFREKVIAIARADAHPDRVCHLGIQWMPRAVASKKESSGEREDEK